jgi:hypothetical protein
MFSNNIQNIISFPLSFIFKQHSKNNLIFFVIIEKNHLDVNFKIINKIRNERVRKQGHN